MSSSLDSVLATDLTVELARLPTPVGILWSQDDLQLAATQFELQKKLRPEAPVRI